MNEQLSKRYAQLGFAIELFEIGDKLKACYQLGYVRKSITSDPVLSVQDKSDLDARAIEIYKQFGLN